MCHSALRDPKFYVLLSQIDAERAAEVRAAGCSCGGVLHSARYPRKPRGGPLEYRQLDHTRLSFCCNRCRQRHTPSSVRYLGRRVYLGAVVLLASALRSALSGKRLHELCMTFCVPRATLDRWRTWWNSDFPATPFWQARRADFMPPVCAALPAELLARFTVTDPFARLWQALRFLAPLSTLSEGR